jgi:ribonuclease HII
VTVIEPTLVFERELLARHPLVIACDEVGRGALAGPVAIGAAVLGEVEIEAGVPNGLRDSKLVAERRRADVRDRARGWVSASAIGWSSAAEIDEIGIMRAMGNAALRALADLRGQGVDVDDAIVLLDGNHDYITPTADPGAPVIVRVKADRDCASASAASIIAKVARDEVMTELHPTHPAYEWHRNKGYASEVHRAAIRAHGLSPHHRASWAIADAPTLW